jgi:hypothetical protein
MESTALPGTSSSRRFPTFRASRQATLAFHRGFHLTHSLLYLLLLRLLQHSSLISISVGRVGFCGGFFHLLSLFEALPAAVFIQEAHLPPSAHAEARAAEVSASVLHVFEPHGRISERGALLQTVPMVHVQLAARASLLDVSQQQRVCAGSPSPSPPPPPPAATASQRAATLQKQLVDAHTLAAPAAEIPLRPPPPPSPAAAAAAVAAAPGGRRRKRAGKQQRPPWRPRCGRMSP